MRRSILLAAIPAPQALPALAALLLLLPSVARAQQVTPPADFLGRPVGADFELADWNEVSGYFRLLARQSPRVRLDTVGTTTEGREFLLALVSSEQNLARLDEIRRHAHTISDPRRATEAERRRAVAEGAPLLMISCGMHSTETAAPQFGMEFAWRLATSEEEPWRSARERVVVGIFPCTNPDGLDEVVAWYREHVGTPYEGAGLTRLYQLYTGHDNNRDWFALTQEETRIVTRQLYAEWRPQVYWDVHQQGRSGERMFVPPFRDPLNPNLDPAIISGITALGTRAVLDMTRAGYSGVSTGVSYDMWWNGGNRNVPVRHNIIGILTEAASVNLASPVWLPLQELRPPRGLDHYAPSHRFPWPWPGGWWRLRDIIDYELAFGRSLLASLSREPELWLRNAMEAAERTAELDAQSAPKAWILPADNPDRGAAERLAGILLLAGVELHVAAGPVRADGRDYPAGSIVIRRDQPYARHVKDLFEIQRYPAGAPPYDVAGWTLPLLFGLRRVEVASELQAELRPVTNAAAAVAAFGGAGRTGVLGGLESDTWDAVFAGLRAGQEFSWHGTGDQAGAFTRGRSGGAGQYLARMPRVGLYSPWTGSMDEGWMRWVLERAGVPFTTVRNEMLRAGQLGDFLDVLLIPDISGRALDSGRRPGTAPERYTGGLDPEGAVAVEEFVRTGGRLVAVDASSAWAVEFFDLPLTDPAQAAGAEFACPGSVLRTIPESSPYTAGLPASLPIFFSRSHAWNLDETARKEKGDKRPLKILLRYAPTRVLLSGYLEGGEHLAGAGAWLVAGHGAGEIHLFGFRPQYRGWSHASFPLVFRALLLEEALAAEAEDSDR